MSTNGKIAITAPVVGEFRNEPPTDFSRRDQREDFKAALKEVRAQFPMDAPLVINGRRVETEEKLDNVSPSEKALMLGRASCATAQHVDDAVKGARAAYRDWSMQPPEARAAVLIRAAELMRRRKFYFCAVLVFEAAKPWREAHADVDEAIDFLEYYAREMMRLGRPKRLQPWILGENNDLEYHPLGVVGVIGPWNFPLAIPVGMAAAALVAGNTVLLKPAEQTPLVASLFVKLMEEAGLPDGVLQFIPGRGEICGARMVQHPDVNMVVFTGSREVGLLIVRESAKMQDGQPFVKRVVTEMGGKNAIIVDSSADLDSSVPDAIYSAFGFSGQKCSACSRLILLKDVYEEYVKRLKEGVEALKVGPAEQPGTQVGPVIDAEAQAKVQSYIEVGKKEAKTLFSANIGDLAERGFFAAPSVFEAKSPSHRLAQEEIFGPVLTVLRAKNFEEALEIANGTPYALTGGVHSRTLSNLQRARREYAAGNLYLNRTITGAIVGRQPFGGYRLSGIGSKAGGPDYLKQFLVARCITENMMRHGVASLVERPVEVIED